MASADSLLPCTTMASAGSLVLCTTIASADSLVGAETIRSTMREPAAEDKYFYEYGVPVYTSITVQGIDKTSCIIKL